MKENEIKTIVKRKRAQSKGLYVVIGFLAVLLIASIILGVTGAYFQATDTATGVVTLGDPVQIEITEGGASVASLTFSDNALPGDVYDSPIGVLAPTDSSDCVVRGKATITFSDGGTQFVELATSDTWVAGEDDYYYYNGVLSSGGGADFVTSVTIPTTLTNESANTSNTIQIVVEAIQHANAAAAAVWTTAPATWTTTYGNG